MARREQLLIYDKSHNLQIFNKNGCYENRCLNVNITDFPEYIQIKLRDASDFVFNYTSNIDARTFDLMRHEQCLDIDFTEFKNNLLDMLQQVQKQEMFLKAEIEGSKCLLVFYGKSRIKSLIFLTIDLQITSQKEIFDEMSATIQEFQNTNKTLNSQLQMSRRLLQEKDFEIEKFVFVNRQLEKKFLGDLQRLDLYFSEKLQECLSTVLGRILMLSKRVLKLLQDVEIVKAENAMKSDSSARLVQSMENLRLESLESGRIINELKRENCNLKSSQLNAEKMLEELNIKLQEKDREFLELEKLKDELERDVKQATLLLAQKTADNDELTKDVVQANQMLVNFNHLFDTKNKEIEELKSTLMAKDKFIQEQNACVRELQSEFQEYKSKFNSDIQNKLSHELFAANKRIEEVEKLNRETVKLNELLTRKLASGDFTHRSFR